LPSQIIAIISLVVALSVAIWQVRVNIRRAKKANVLPVTSAAIEEFRSESFRESLQELIISAQRNPPPVVGFEQVADDWRKHAYKEGYSGALDVMRNLFYLAACLHKRMACSGKD